MWQLITSFFGSVFCGSPRVVREHGKDQAVILIPAAPSIVEK